jgi:hypothetical protein
MKGGFLLEYYIADDCEDCKDSGGQCRVDDTVELSGIWITLLHRLVHIQHYGLGPNTQAQHSPSRWTIDIDHPHLVT